MPPLRASVPALAFVLITGCRLVTDAGFPDGAVPLEPPAPYRMWWALTEQCSGLSGDFEQVRWFVLPGARELPSGHHGYWYGGLDDRIVLAEGSVLNGSLVRHEMLHALAGAGYHVPKYFGQRCGGVVSCSRDCEDEAGAPPAPVADARIISVHELEVTLDVAPPDPRFERDSGWLALVVSATNPYDEPVRVLLEPVAPGHPASPTFGFEMRGAHSYMWVWGSLAAFGPGATQRRVFDQRIYRDSVAVFGYFNANRTDTVEVLIAP